MSDTLTLVISFVFTIMVLSYLLGDNPLFRVALSIFVGVSAGIAAGVAWSEVILPMLVMPLISGSASQQILAILPFILGLLMLAKLTPRTAKLGNLPMAFLVGVGAAVAVGGAVMGTLIPQVQASSIDAFKIQTSTDLGEKILMGGTILVGTLTTLVYFHFGAKSTPAGPERSKLVHYIGQVGQFFIAITLGVLFAGAYAAAMTALVGRVVDIWNLFSALIQ
jgi:hypothetical protein